MLQQQQSGPLLEHLQERPNRRAERELPFMWADRLLQKPLVWGASVAAVLLLQVALILTHRAWLDEWQAVLVAYQSPDFATLFEQLRFEGHPPLWYVFLRAICAAGASPGHALKIASLLYAAAGNLLILRYAPFPRFERLMIVLSELMLIEYFSISRSLGLGVVIFLWALAAWRSRWVWLPIALLPFCDFLFGLLSICLLVFRWRDRHDARAGIFWPGLALWCLLSLAAAYSVRPAPDIVSDAPHRDLMGFLLFIQQIGMNIAPWQILGGHLAWNGSPPIILSVALPILFLAFLYYSTRGNRSHLIVIFCFMAVMCLFSIFVYALYFRQTSLVALLLLGSIWLRSRPGEALSAIERTWLISLAFCGLVTAGFMLSKPFDSAKETVSIIKEGGFTDKPWFAYPAYRAIALSGEGGFFVGNLETGCSSTFLRWNFRTKITTNEQFRVLLRKRGEQYGSYYLMTAFNMRKRDANVRHIATIEPGYNELEYHLWEVKAEPQAVRARLQTCVSGLRPL